MIQITSKISFPEVMTKRTHLGTKIIIIEVPVAISALSDVNNSN